MISNAVTVMKDVVDAIQRLALDRGYVLTGDLSLTLPAAPGLLDVRVIVYDEHVRAARATFALERVAIVRTQSLPPDPKLFGYTGNICPICSSTRMIRSGACEKCEDCGNAGGCG